MRGESLRVSGSSLGGRGSDERLVSDQSPKGVSFRALSRSPSRREMPRWFLADRGKA